MSSRASPAGARIKHLAVAPAATTRSSHLADISRLGLDIVNGYLHGERGTVESETLRQFASILCSEPQVTFINHLRRTGPSLPMPTGFRRGTRRVGVLSGQRLKMLSVRHQSFAHFLAEERY